MSIMSSILAAVSQRPLFSEAPLKEFVSEAQLKEFVSEKVERRYGPSTDAELAIRSSEMRVMPIFATEKQQTWLVVNPWRVYCILDDRSWQKPQIQWNKQLNDVLPVRAEEDWSVEAGALVFGTMTKKWLYSKRLFPDEPVQDVVTRFLSDTAS